MNDTIRRMIFSGGAINYAILAMYVVMIAVCIERLVTYLASSYSKRVVMSELKALKSASQIEEMFARPRSSRYKHSATRLAADQALRFLDADVTVLNEALDFRAEEIRARPEVSEPSAQRAFAPCECGAAGLGFWAR